MNRQMMVPVVVLLVVIALIALLVVLGQREQAGEVAAGKPAAAAAAAKAKSKVRKGKAPPAVDRAQLLHVAESPAERADAPEGAPNVVLVAIDALRRDQTTPYGAPPEVTPFLAELAGAGVVFDDAIAAGPWARPSLVAMLTGHHAMSVGMVQTSDEGNHRVLADGVTTLAERLQAGGWHTVGVSTNFNANHKYGMAQGFDAYLDSHPASFNPRTRRGAGAAVDELLTLLGERPEGAAGRPVFAQLVLVDLHKPFLLKPEDAKPFEGPDHNVAPYRAMVNRTDAALKKLAAGLAEAGITRENTVFAVIGAHGEGLSMPKHHGKQHGRTLYRSAVQVPWIVAGPGVKAGHRVTGLSHHTDVMPTLLELAGLSVGEERLAGSSLAAQVRGEATTPRTHAYTDTWYFTANHAAVFTPTRACQKNFGTTDGQSIPTGCYDRVADPDANELADAPDAPLLAELDAWRAARGAELEAWPHLQDAK